MPAAKPPAYHMIKTSILLLATSRPCQKDIKSQKITEVDGHRNNVCFCEALMLTKTLIHLMG